MEAWTFFFLKIRRNYLKVQRNVFIKETSRKFVPPEVILCVRTQSKNENSPQASSTLRFALCARAFFFYLTIPHRRPSKARWRFSRCEQLYPWPPWLSIKRFFFFFFFFFFFPFLLPPLSNVPHQKKICFNQVFFLIQKQDKLFLLNIQSVFFLFISNLRCCRIVYSDSFMQKAFSPYSSKLRRRKRRREKKKQTNVFN